MDRIRLGGGGGRSAVPGIGQGVRWSAGGWRVGEKGWFDGGAGGAGGVGCGEGAGCAGGAGCAEGAGVAAGRGCGVFR